MNNKELETLALKIRETNSVLWVAIMLVQEAYDLQSTLENLSIDELCTINNKLSNYRENTSWAYPNMLKSCFDTWESAINMLD